MHNTVYLIGRLTNEIELVKEGEKDVARIIIAVQRSFKNEEGIYETDFVPIKLYNNIANNTSEYCHKGDLIGVRGRLQRYSSNDYTANGMPILEVVADKLTYLATNKTGEFEE